MLLYSVRIIGQKVGIREFASGNSNNALWLASPPRFPGLLWLTSSALLCKFESSSPPLVCVYCVLCGHKRSTESKSREQAGALFCCFPAQPQPSQPVSQSASRWEGNKWVGVSLPRVGLSIIVIRRASRGSQASESIRVDPWHWSTTDSVPHSRRFMGPTYLGKCGRVW